MIYKINPDDAFEYIQYAHDQRKSDYEYKYFSSSIDSNEKNNGILIKRLFQRGQVPTPQTSVQRNQVREIVDIIFSVNNHNNSIIKQLNKNARRPDNNLPENVRKPNNNLPKIGKRPNNNLVENW